MSITVKDICVGYGKKNIVKNACMNIEKGEVVTIVGPNGSGKSTIIKALSRCLPTNCGEIIINGKNVNEIKTKDLAKILAVLPQTKHFPHDVTVEGLVQYGRYPHLGWQKKLTKMDYEVVDWAIDRTHLNDLRKRYLRNLSGGERQRAWISMALSQQPSILILDEPTTYLDVSYQLEVLELIKELNNTIGLTVIMVLHDINQAARYSHKLYVINKGEVCRVGAPKDVLNKSLLKDIFKVEATIYEDLNNCCPYFIPERLITEVKL